MEEGPSHACTTQPDNPSEKSFLSHIGGVHTVQNWPLKAAQKLHSFNHFKALVGVPETLKTRIDLSPIHWSICQAHGTAFSFRDYVFFLFFFFFSFFLFFWGAALEFCVRYMAEYPHHYTNGFAYGNFIMVIL
jgi:hypothetical protein